MKYYPVIWGLQYTIYKDDYKTNQYFHEKSGHPVLFQELEAWSPSQLPGKHFGVHCLGVVGHGVGVIHSPKLETPRNSRRGTQETSWRFTPLHLPENVPEMSTSIGGRKGSSSSHHFSGANCWWNGGVAPVRFAITSNNFIHLLCIQNGQQLLL